MVHNLGLVAWDKMGEPTFAFDWALEASSKMKEAITNRNHKVLIDYVSGGKALGLAIPTPEHFLPLIYTLGLQ
jgi:4,5-DOPA dioxygenase extradiol